jgi:formylglycine-generating enzyme required for sulfatase activity/MinD-like ATPase involved in chromosome partitioning or flagellar assembly
MIYTFYSYKGGVGRSMALANMAEIFCQAGLRVLMVDWDLEAPGLERFFPVNSTEILDRLGIMDMLSRYKQKMSQEKITVSVGEDLPFDKPGRLAVNIHTDSYSKGQLYLLTAGKRSKEHFSKYANAVLTFDWQDFYENWEGEAYFEWLRKQFNQVADVVLVDSRTGVTEMGGVCTYQLADVVVMFCSANQQSVEGTYNMLLNLKRPEIQELRGRPLEVLVVPARIEDAESNFLNEFQQEFLKLFAKHAPEVLGGSSDQLWRLAIPYTPRYAYKETIAVLEKGKASAKEMIEAFNLLAFTISRLAPEDSAIRLALPETEVTIGGETIVGSIVGGDVVVGDKVVGKDYVTVHGDVYLGPPPREPAEALAIYRRIMAQWCGQLPLRGVDIGAADPSTGKNRLGLATVYVDLDTKTQVEITEAEKEEGNQCHSSFSERAVRPLTALEAVIANRRSVLLGDPGSGKSTFVNYLAYCLAAGLSDHLPGWLEVETDALPVVVTLRDFARNLPDPLPGRAEPSHLSDFIVARLETQGLGFAVDSVYQLLEEGQVLLMLDGLDELPTVTQQAFVHDAVTALARRYPDNRYLVTCRVLSYQPPATPDAPDLRLTGFSTFELAPFDRAKIDRFIEAWYAELAQTGVVRIEDATGLAHQLKEAVRRPDLWHLAFNPLLLTVMALVHTHKGRLPYARAMLYEDTVDILLWRWEQVKAGGRGDAPRIRQLLLQAGRTDVDLKRVLAQLAYEAHAQARPEDYYEAPTDIGELRLQKAIASLKEGDFNWARQVIQTMTLRAGLLLERAPEVFTFPSRMFQEYLAGIHLASLPNFVQQACKLADQEGTWREVILLAAGRMVYRLEDTARPLALVGELCSARTADDELSWRKVWLAGDVLLEMGVNRVTDSALGRDLLARVQARLVDLLEGGHLSPRQRTAAGDTLGHLGDPRLDFAWCEVPAGPFVMGSDGDDALADEDEGPQHEVRPPAFRISKYPVTNAQYAVFVQDGGYTEKRRECWTEYGWHWKGNRATPDAIDDVFELPNHPVVEISWYEVVAFCHWLTERLRTAGEIGPEEAVMLPSEVQWEKAARGNDGRRFPWGDEASPDRANYDATGISGTSAVGCFPGGASPYGVLDMSGDTWEWCRTKWQENYVDYRDDNDLEGEARRVVRGGAFDSGREDIRCSARIGELPNTSRNNIGFRVVIVLSVSP